MSLCCSVLEPGAGTWARKILCSQWVERPRGLSVRMREHCPPRADPVPSFMTARGCPGHGGELALSSHPSSLFTLAFRKLRASLGLGHSSGWQLSGFICFLPLCLADASFFIYTAQECLPINCLEFVWREDINSAKERWMWGWLGGHSGLQGAASFAGDAGTPYFLSGLSWPGTWGFPALGGQAWCLCRLHFSHHG